ncbi:MAG: hypothetical protein ACTSYU_12455 [Promethearchaeota archaeon]
MVLMNMPNNKFSISFLSFIGVLMIIIGSIFLVQPVSAESSPKSNGVDKLDFVFLLHANQANVPYSIYANEVNYHHVTEMMLTHPNMHFPLHYSGTLLTDLMWVDPTTIGFLQSGLDSGQFEIIGSTYAQNIIYSLPNYDNQIQIEQHRQVIDSMLGADPVGFWNPERCWNQTQYVDLLVDNGYTYTFVEDHIIADSISVTGYDEYKVRTTSVGDKSLYIFNDDKHIISLIDGISRITELPTHPDVIAAVDDVIEYLYTVYENDNQDDYCVFYGQDMEAWGLWQEEGYLAPLDSIENVVARLDYFFDRLEAESDWLSVGTPSEFLAQMQTVGGYIFEDIATIVDGSATWMESPVQNAGYTDWFDYNLNDPDWAEFRGVFDAVRTRMQEIWQDINVAGETQNITAALLLMDYAEFVYAANQYEFGCIGCEFEWFYRTKAALITAEAALYSLNPNPAGELIETDNNMDGFNEIIFRDAKMYYVISDAGGRLINVFDIENGIVLLGNDLISTYQNQDPQDYPNGMPISSALDDILPGDMWGRNDFSVKLRPKSMIDSFTDGEYDSRWRNEIRDYEIVGSNLIFELEISGRRIIKQIQIDVDFNLVTDYYIENVADGLVSLDIGLSFTPDNLQTLMTGQDQFSTSSYSESSDLILEVWNNNSGYGLRTSIATGYSVNLKPDDFPSFLALGYTLNVPDIVTGEAVEITITTEFLRQDLSVIGNTDDTDDIDDIDDIDDSGGDGDISAIQGFYGNALAVGSLATLILIKRKQK